MPFSQDGVNSVTANLRQDSAMRYLLEWTNPSLKEDADYVAMSQSYMNQGYVDDLINTSILFAGQTILFQYLPQNIRNQSINHMEYMCQSVINSCSYQGILIQAYDCCKNILYQVPTTHGLCWVFHDRSMSQNSSSSLKQFAITFQMSRNSWYMQQTTPSHPGVDIFLRENADDVVALVNQLENPIRLLDKKGIRLKMRKEKKADTRHSHCGQSLGEAQSADRNARQNNRTNLLMCSIMVSIQYCQCHPLFAEMIPYDIRKFRDFSIRVNSTQVCTIDQYEACARRYVDVTRPSAWTDPIPSDLPGADEVAACRKDNPYPCELTSYPGTVDQYDLPAAYQSTQDYVARLVLEYSTMRVTEVLVSKDPSLYELLSYIGYNIATWFAIGHIIWSVYVWIRDIMCCSNKISPESPRRAFSISNPIEVQPIENGKESTDAEEAS
ncbi:hypothetical protein NECAME_05441 [Necator americanus]|uniref:Amiloride-sensitive sodium channel n=1 Tax=Necator americanus TaxID=51031 RepID=W2SJD9_NECAM|nr:hypothetical protein NECAME_05441 [Necator americanus]ETN68852.1 hypothetical protein NECAME_05441 [Necator americanus]